MIIDDQNKKTLQPRTAKQKTKKPSIQKIQKKKKK
jgi:hypothetical protein